MKKRIDLFSQRNESQTAQKYLQYGKRATYWVLLFGVLSLMALFGTYFWFNRYLSDLKSKKNTYNRYILANKEFNQDIKHFVNKFSLLKTYLESDAAGYAYYKHLKSIIEPSGDVDTIDSFNINNLQVVSFSLSVPSYDEALQILAFFEQKDVLEQFDSLVLESFDITENSNSYTMSFNGKLKHIEQ